MHVRRILVACLLLLVMPLALPAQAQRPSSEAVDLARARDPGIVTLVRHAKAPGAGDPASFTLADCATQRNLSEQGRQDARRLGKALRAVGVRDADVRTSQWCRCVETARLLDVGRVLPAPFLNSFLAERGENASATRVLRAAILQKIDSRRPLLMVTHQVNITALTGLTPVEGEVVFVRGTAAGTVDVVGRVRLP